LAGNSVSDFLARSPQGCALFVGAGVFLIFHAQQQKRWFYAPIRPRGPTAGTLFTRSEGKVRGVAPFGHAIEEALRVDR